VADKQDGPDEAYKGLQRKISRLEEENKTKTLQLMDREAADADVKVLRHGLGDLITAIKDGDGLDGGEALAKIQNDVDEASKGVAVVKQYRTAITENLMGSDYEWESEELEAARGLWNERDFAGASRIVEELVGTTGTDAKVSALVVEKLKELDVQVDTETSQGTTGAPTPFTAESIIRDPKGGKAAYGEALDDYFAKMK